MKTDSSAPGYANGRGHRRVNSNKQFRNGGPSIAARNVRRVLGYTIDIGASQPNNLDQEDGSMDPPRLAPHISFPFVEIPHYSASSSSDDVDIDYEKGGLL